MMPCRGTGVSGQCLMPPKVVMAQIALPQCHGCAARHLPGMTHGPMCAPLRHTCRISLLHSMPVYCTRDLPAYLRATISRCQTQAHLVLRFPACGLTCPSYSPAGFHQICPVVFLALGEVKATATIQSPHWVAAASMYSTRLFGDVGLGHHGAGWLQ